MKAPNRHDELEAAALAHAELGHYVVPLNEPLFDTAGNCCGCTCEAYKRSNRYRDWLRAKGLEKKFDPNFTCRTPGKHPRLADWEAQASNDPKQIRAWWERWPTANLGLAVGQSGLVTFDLDSYKDIYGDDGDLFSLADKQTATQLSGRGGEHLLYQMPEGRAYTNANNTLPPGIDIRGVGGMIVLAPSIHPCGNHYQWEEGYSVFECSPKPLPAALQALLDTAHQNSTPTALALFTTITTERPNLLRWHISKSMRELINAPGCVGQRSENDMKVCTALVYAGATPDDVLAIFQHYPIGTAGKYAERGPEYLARTVGKAQAFVAAHPRPNVRATLDNLMLWARTTSFAQHIDPQFLASDGTYRTDSTDTKATDAILGEMKTRQRLTINIGKKRLAKLAGIGSCNTILAALARLSWLFGVTMDPLQGMQITLDLSRLQQIDPHIKDSIVFNGDQSSENDSKTPEINEYSPRKADEPFLAGVSKLVRERVQDIAKALDIPPAQAKAEYTFAGLGETCLRLIDAHKRCGDMTAQEAAQETGKKLSSVRNGYKKLVQHGIVEAEREGAHGPKVYSLAPDVWRRIDEIAPNLRTYGSASRRENKRLESAQQWCKKDIEEVKEEIRAAQMAQDVEAEQAAQDKKKALDARFEGLVTKRLPHLKRLHPDLSAKAIERLALDVAAYKRRGAAPSPAVRTARHDQAADHRSTVRIIRELADSFSDVDTPKEQVYKAIMKFGTFDEKLVKAVLQSPKQMKNYETLPDVRKRLAHAELMADLQMTPAAPGHEQPALMGGAA